jgi:uncharacterized protein YqeY
MLHEQIKNGIKEAMMAKDKVRLEVMRGLSTAFMNELVSKGKTPQDMLSDEESLTVITRTAKQRRDSIEQFKSGGREDLVEEEQAQLKILEEFLPTLMSKEEVLKIAKEKQNELGITDVAKKGMLMAEIMKILKGKADGSLVKEVVDSLF